MAKADGWFLLQVGVDCIREQPQPMAGNRGAKQDSNQRPPMRTACACPACLSISRWAPETSTKPRFGPVHD
eukprot:747259-Hanusia_phi.AAC.4